MSDFVTPLLLAGLLATSDYKSTQYFHDRNIPIREFSPIKNNSARALTQFGVLYAGDLIFQKKHPKYKWHYRVGMTLLVGGSVTNNILQRRKIK